MVEIEGMRGPVGVTPSVDESTGEPVVQLLQGSISAVFRVASFCWNHCAPLTILFLPCLSILTINSCSGPPGCVPSSRSLRCPVYPQNIFEIERFYNAIFRYRSPRGYTKATSTIPELNESIEKEIRANPKEECCRVIDNIFWENPSVSTGA